MQYIIQMKKKFISALHNASNYIGKTIDLFKLCKNKKLVVCL
jgi:hypothetical protein